MGQLQREVAALRLPPPIIVEAPRTDVPGAGLPDDVEQALVELATSAATYRFAISDERAKMHAGTISDHLRRLAAENGRLRGALADLLNGVTSAGELGGAYITASGDCLRRAHAALGA